MISFAAVEYFFNLFESYLSYSLHLFGRQRFQKNYKGRYRLKLIGGSVRELKTKVVFTLLLLLAEARRTSLLFGAIAPDRQILVGCNYGGHQDHVSCHSKSFHWLHKHHPHIFSARETFLSNDLSSVCQISLDLDFPMCNMCEF